MPDCVPVVIEVGPDEAVVIEVGVPGPAGPVGPAGPAGPPGPPGPTPGPITLTAGETIAIGDLVTLDSAGDVILADATFSTGRWRFIGVATTAAAAAASVSVQTSQGALAAATFAGAPAAGANGTQVWLDDTPGRATLSPPLGSGRVRTLVGILQGADGVSVSPNVLLSPQHVSRIP